MYGDVMEDIFDMSNVRIFKEIEKKRTMGDFSKVGLRILCYYKRSVVMLLWYRIVGISRKLESERKQMSCAQMLHI